MKIFGRSPRRVLGVLMSLGDYLAASWRCVKLFNRPGAVLLCYLRRQSPRNRRVRFRNGVVLYLSLDPSDVLTVFLIFCRRDYGVIVPGVSVVDIGANIGVFAVYAALGGASSVYCYEPSEESFELLMKNITGNGLQDIVKAHKAAVVGKPRGDVQFPRKSSVHNCLSDAPDAPVDLAGCAWVPAISFEEIGRNLRGPTLLKMDCEGGEYDIVMSAEAAAFEQVDEVRLEYHVGPKAELAQRFTELGFAVVRRVDESEAGNWWLVRARPR